MAPASPPKARGTPREPAWFNSKLRVYLHQLRKEHHLSMADLAKESGYSASTLNAWERGYRAPHTVDLMNWCESLGYRLCVVPITPTSQLTRTARLERQAELALQAEE